MALASIDPSRCIGCRACVQACAECDTHPGVSMIHPVDVERADTVQTTPVVSMHCEEPACVAVCPADAIKRTPDVVVQSALKDHCRLGVHTEMFSDGLIDLIERGVVTNEEKTKHRFRTVAAFLNGTRRLYDFVDDNPSVFMMDIAYVNDTSVIRKLPKMTAINSAIEVDLTGQIAADSIGHRQYSGVGGQMDFMRGASLSEDGKPIIALPSVTSRGESRIASIL